MNPKFKSFLKNLGRSLICGAAAYSAFVLYTDRVPYSVVYNRSPSIPMGLYLMHEVSPAKVKVGDIGCFVYESPEWAKDRKYFPPQYRLCKPVTAGPGTSISHDGVHLAMHEGGESIKLGDFAKTDSNGRPLVVALPPSGVVPENTWLMVASKHSNSFDSRYLGYIAQHRVNFIARPLLTW